MSFNHAVRVTLPYDDCEHIIAKWADRSFRAVVYQHLADEEVSKTHVHLALYGCGVKAEALKRLWTDCPGKGNEFWSWKDLADFDVSGNKYLTYMSKGNLAPVFVKNLSSEVLDESRQSWVEPAKADKAGDHSERIIRQVVDHFKNEDFKTRYRVRDMEEDGIGIAVIHKNVRSYTFRLLWREHRKVPHASFFKIVADSAFLRICERLERFDEGVTCILDV